MGNARTRTWLAELALVGVVAVWGWTFVTVKDAIAVLPEFTFNALRFTVAALAFLPFLLRAGPRRDESRPATERRGVLFAGIIAGAILAVGYALQTLGLERTSAARSGVITGISVALVPIGVGALFRVRVRRAEWTGVCLALLGFLFLGTGKEPLGSGDLLVLGCAVAFAAHVIALDRLAPGRAVLPLAATQVWTAAILFTAVALWRDREEWPAGGFSAIPLEVWGAVALTGIVATTLAFSVQTRAQQVSTPTRIALILALEPVFAAAAARIAHDEAIGVEKWVGGSLVIAGMLWAELAPRRRG